MGNKLNLNHQQVAANIQACQKLMAQQEMDYLYISSFDPYLNEYVPLSDSHRFYVTNFTGSMAEVLVPAKGKPRLYVDGRYHEQADLECDLDQIEVVKVGANRGLLQELKDDLKKLQPNKIGLELDRTAYGFYRDLKELGFEVKGLANQELSSVIQFETRGKLPAINGIDAKYIGRSTQEKLQLIFEEEQNCAHFVTAIDSLAWITNSRGYHIPFSSAFLGVGLLTAAKAYIFIDAEVEVKVSDPTIEFLALPKLRQELGQLQQKLQLEKVYFDSSMLNALLYQTLDEVFGKDKLLSKKGGIVGWQSIKEEAELNAIRESFQKSDTAIYNTLKWVKDQVASGAKISELDLYHKTSQMYQQQGAITQSFNTISGVDANGSIIHYGDPKADVLITPQSMVLLDSGGYFAPGFATDTTRTFMGGYQEGNAKQKEIFTLTLKGTLNLQNAVFKPGTRGGGLDAIARQPLYQAGYDYNHGTGHGVGIHVHEGEAGISPVRNFLLKPGQVISIEPGIYIPGFGGVRIENIGIVIEHPKYPGFLGFESLVYIGFDPLLIDESLLNDQEKIWLDVYEQECAKRGRSFR